MILKGIDMKTIKMMSLLTVFLFFSCSTADLPARPKRGKNPVITWQEPVKIVEKGGYPRVHRLNDDRLMLCFSRGGHGYVRFSGDNGYTWSEEAKVISGFDASNESSKTFVQVSNPEFAQLSDSHPSHPGRIIYSVNYRPKNEKTTVHPYTIAIVTSDDNGQTWSEPRHIYKSGLWSTDILRGCWEPFILELPDGTVQCYFADETPYYSVGESWQNISVIESTDGGETWSKERIVSQNGRHRDGMAVVLLYNDTFYMAIESSGPGGIRLHPIIVYNTLEDNWKNTATFQSPFRFDPFVESLENTELYSGAPYIIQTDNYIVYSYQSSDGADVHDARHSSMEVQVIPKSEIKKPVFNGMRGASRPIDVDQSVEGGALWNSLCDLGNDEVLAVSQYLHGVWITRGKISMK